MTPAADGPAPTGPGSVSAARPRPIVIVVIDGFGIGTDPSADAIAAARMPVWRDLLSRWPHAALDASEGAVGLPVGQMGNSEVGHLNIGAGKPVLQDLPRIDAAIASGAFVARPALLAACDRAAAAGRPLHLVSLVGPGGVHAHDTHLVAAARLAADRGAPSVRVHAILDGRDTPPRSAIGFVPDLEARLDAAHPDARIATVAGRYYPMDRDKRWERTAAGYRAIVHGVAPCTASSAAAAVEAGYARGENDEFVQPTLVAGVDGTLRDGDAVVHCNFRADRARQLTHALADADFDAFDRAESGPIPRDLLVTTMTEYEADLPVLVVFPPETATSLAEVAAAAGWRQLHVAETEKYAHVTYFFNGGVEAPWPGEERVLVPSPRVSTYDLQPEMSAAGVTDVLVEAIRSGGYDLIVANYANPDMVGHTGVWDATVRACETVDACLARVVAAVEAVHASDPAGPGALLAITADHGNADRMRDADGRTVTAHSLNRVPFVLVGRAVEGRVLRDGILADVAPTIVELGDLPRWDGMTGTSLLRPPG
ncbi:MAG: 2,3-bisphosphoglycerate-independent phosphoglycerate mutase [Chloroflexi bacterium]|nr:2,3-bisphosphoglycerate-independent phosphoglycerate mutase [Chloroflexota bacterium]